MPKPFDVDTLPRPRRPPRRSQEVADARPTLLRVQGALPIAAVGSHRQLADRQNLLYAHDRYALLLIFQAMDAAGKDGVIKHVMSGINPQGCQVFSFKHPSATELDHDFLWRTTECLPERGRIGIFNRSYYEEVLIVRVHPEILQAQRLPDEALEGSGIWKRRYQSIVDHERHLHRNGTRIVKFFLHLSKEEQARRFLARIDDPAKNWKFSAGDIAERARWKDYMRAYEECLEATSTEHAPWFIVPADDKQNAQADRVAGHCQHDESPEDAISVTRRGAGQGAAADSQGAA